MDAIYLKDSQAIAEGEKTAIPQSRPYKSLPGRHLLIIKDVGVVGVVAVGSAKAMSAKEFDENRGRHKVSSYHRMRWWGNTEPLYVYPIDEVLLFPAPLPIDIPPGSKMLVDTEYELKELPVLCVINGVCWCGEE